MKAWELLEQKGWCQGTYALNKHSMRVHPTKRAHAFCAIGAIRCIYKTQERMEVAAKKVLKYIGLNNISIWNDSPGRTKEEVIEALRKADV